MIERAKDIPWGMWLALWLLASTIFAVVWSLSVGRIHDRIERDYAASMRRADGSLRWPGKSSPARPRLVTPERLALYREELETRRATREGNRGAIRQPKGSGPRLDAPNVTRMPRLNQ